MGVYVRPDSPFYWVLLELPQQPARRESTRIPHRGASPEQTKDLRQLAHAAYAARMSDLARARYDLPSEQPTITVGAYLKWYARHISAHKRGAGREAEILQTLTAAFGTLDLPALTRARVQEWMTGRVATVSPATVNRELDLLKHVLTSAVPQYLRVSPLVGLPRLPMANREPVLLTRQKEPKLLTALRLADRALVLLALDALLRLSEIVALQRAQDHRSYLTILNPKSGSSRKVPVSTRLRQALDAVPKKGRYYFPHRRRAENPRDYRNSVKSMLKRACKAARIRYGRGRGLTFHALRHTGATRMVEAGVDLRTVQMIGGWTSLRQLTRYTHPTDALRRAAVETVGSGLMGSRENHELPKNAAQ